VHTGTSHTTPDNDCTDALIGASHKPVSNFPHIFNSAIKSGTGQALSLPYSQHIANKAGQALPVQLGLKFSKKIHLRFPIFHRNKRFPGYVLAGVDRPG
jgi:hypothetical protein